MARSIVGCMASGRASILSTHACPRPGSRASSRSALSLQAAACRSPRRRARRAPPGRGSQVVVLAVQKELCTPSGWPRQAAAPCARQAPRSRGRAPGVLLGLARFLHPLCGKLAGVSSMEKRGSAWAWILDLAQQALVDEGAYALEHRVRVVAGGAHGLGGLQVHPPTNTDSLRKNCCSSGVSRP